VRVDAAKGLPPSPAGFSLKAFSSFGGALFSGFQTQMDAGLPSGWRRVANTREDTWAMARRDE